MAARGKENYMTLKEKVTEVQPENINDIWTAGVKDCPGDYDFLNTGDSDYKCPFGVENNCFACWNREYKEVPDANKQ
jgi:hypothetical protein